MKKNTPLISIVVPVYNVEEYLNKCLNSIVNQTYHNIEIILIDDGSKDNCGEICDEYASKDSRIVVVHKINEGIASARNMGIEIASGDYITFVDSDDWVDENICELLLESIKKYDVQAAMCSYVREYPNNSISKVIHPTDIVLNNRDIQRKLCGLVGKELERPENLDCYDPMWGKLYLTSAIKGINVTDVKLIGSAEDLLFNLEAFNNIENIAYINIPLYHYRKRESSSITTTYRPKLEKQWNVLYSKIDDIISLNGLGNDCIIALNNRIALNILGIGLNCICGTATFKEKYMRVKMALENEERSKLLLKLPLKYMPLHWKVFFFAAKNRITILFYFLLVVLNKLKGKV